MKNRLIYITPSPASFIQKDIDLLSKNYFVLTQNLPWDRKKKIFSNLLSQFIFLIRNMPGSRFCVVMFGGYWSFFPALLGKIFRKPVFIILGGADCVSFPEYNYGSLRKPVLRTIIKWSYSLAERLLPVSDALVQTNYNYDSAVKEKKQGFLHFFPHIKTPYTVIYNGFDHEYWQPGLAAKNDLHFVTIAQVEDATRFKIKGIDFIIEIAKQFPGHYFHIAGMSERFSGSLGAFPVNIIIHPFLNKEELLELLGSCRFYLQLSISEGFPNALCEAMLCECVPVGSSVGSIPFIIGNSGSVIETKNVSKASEKINELIGKTSVELDLLGKSARDNIKNRFPLDSRENAITEILLTYSE